MGLKTMDVIAARLLQQGRGGLSPVAGMKTHSSGPSSKPRFTRAVTTSFSLLRTLVNPSNRVKTDARLSNWLKLLKPPRAIRIAKLKRLA